ncbi:NAD(P)/FAD-dependent oxidoreductase [Ideonella sp. BN130291]|uniref:NAD(P)/FAD-dependent oxidoreductase n=1 Tax=Ideonella sp. BN130291 TaxID=3112940 RepID=UPI002E277074|nr:geranylgeranyl reductase family protein [Ideonella sp. BN130291]
MSSESSVSVPAQCDVLVVGAGPAGSACAQLLAQRGLHVVLADQHTFPRDKTCGDGLIPDSHAALKRLGVFDEVMQHAQPARHVGCIGPRGGRIDVPGALAVLPRRVLDDILCRSAQRAGAKPLMPARFEAPIEEGGRVVGARLKVGDASQEIRARWVVLATGAVPQAMLAAGLCERRTPSGVALRGYVKNDAMVGRIQALEIVWHKKLRPGYGWIFPCRDGVFNIGVGIVQSHKIENGRGAMQDTNLRDVFKAFCDFYEPARELMAGGTMQGELKGAPLRCTLEGARYSRPGLIATGEAVGSTYSFSGEGIGKALETGMLAAEALLRGHEQPLDEAAVRAEYEQRLLALKPRFELYEKANKVNAHPWLADLLIWRAKKSERLLRRMSGVLNETSNPGHLVSVKGITRLFLE